VRCYYSFSAPQGNSAGGGTGTGCNGTYRSDLGSYSITWTQPDGATMVCNASDPDLSANCPAGTPCIYRNPNLTVLGETDGSVVGTCQ
jgi:hypothetical protein